MLEIKSVKNPLVKKIKSLHRKKYRQEEKLFIIEGLKIIQEALYNKVHLEYIIYTDKFLLTREGKELFEKIKHKNNIVYVGEEVFKEISDTENPQGILGLCGIEERNLEEIFALKKPSLLFLDGIQDPGNMGTIIRSGDAFNIAGLIIGEGCVDPYNPKVVRSTMGSIFRTPIFICNNSIDCLSQIKEKGIRVLSTSFHGEDISKEAFDGGVAIVLGNESRGVNEEIINLSNELLKIPMMGEAESLNVGVAASIIMYESMKAKD